MVSCGCTATWEKKYKELQQESIRCAWPFLESCWGRARPLDAKAWPQCRAADAQPLQFFHTNCMPNRRIHWESEQNISIGKSNGCDQDTIPSVQKQNFSKHVEHLSCFLLHGQNVFFWFKSVSNKKWLTWCKMCDTIWWKSALHVLSTVPLRMSEIFNCQ